jgi:hypothetical protein
LLNLKFEKMKANMNSRLMLTAISIGLGLTGFSKEIPGLGQKVASPSADENVNKVVAVCSSPSNGAQLDVNNVRTIIWTGGDMWWDFTNAYYKVPKDGSANSLFAASLWLGGLDAGGQLKVAAMTYRQNGIDFWPGPLDTVTTSVDQSVCAEYDKIFQMSRSDVDTFLNYQYISSNMSSWPGNGDISKNQGKFLAPFNDVDGDGVYNPSAGDYPDYDINSEGVDATTQKCKHKLFGDKTLWWVFNDKGDIHSETNGLAMGVEVRAQAFAFKTDNEINDMTFYSYEVINRSSYTLTNTYFTVWNDADLGNYIDDLVGCDVKRGLGFIFNGDGIDESAAGAPGYNNTPPAIGCDFFQGPLADPGDGINNDRDSTYDQTTGAALGPLIDEVGEQIIMSGFFYYNNNIGNYPPPTLNPSNASQYYGYMTGFWRDGSPFTYGLTGYNSGGHPCKFVFPGNTDPGGYGTGDPTDQNWYAYQPPSGPAVDQPADKRFLESAGPFTLQPGAVNYVTFGMPWARTSTLNSPWSSVELLLSADDKAQALFDNCFNVINGPDAPDVTIQELDKELILYLSQKPTSNNYNETYTEVDPTINPPLTIPNLDKSYDFEGYIIYQLKDVSVTESDLYDQDKARIVAQCDISNGKAKLVNYEYDASVGAAVPKVKVDGADAGILKSFKITDDKFSTGNSTLVNHKTYYFMAVSYAFNQYVEYKADQYIDLNDPLADQTVPNFYGQKLPFLRGRRNIKKYTGIPHIPSMEVSGTVVNSWYGLGPKITRIEGQGNGGNSLDLTDETVAQILGGGSTAAGADTVRVNQITYVNSKGPIKVKVIDPLNVPNGNFTVKILAGAKTDGDTAGVVRRDSMWMLSFTPVAGSDYYGPTTVYSTKSIRLGNEQIIPEMGISVVIEQVSDPADGSTTFGTVRKTDFIEASMTFSDATKPWLSAIKDQDGDDNPYNWIWGGTAAFPTNTEWSDYGNDPDQVWEGVLGGTWAPYRMVARTKVTNPVVTMAPGVEKSGLLMADAQLRCQASVDVVITSDKSKWTRCPVLEECPNATATFPAGIEKLNLRGDPSVDKAGKKTGDLGYNSAEGDLTGTTGMGWFPGYAINVETGERLNMAFGENSTMGIDNGRDMIWNPTSRIYDQGFNPVFGGMHYIYIFGHNSEGYYTAADADLPLGSKDVRKYDYGYSIYKMLATNKTTKKREVFRDAMWVNIPVLDEDYGAISTFGKNLEIPTDVKVRIRVRKPYRYGLGTHYASTTVAIPTNADDTKFPTDTLLSGAQNNNWPMYTFNTSDIYTELGNAEAAVNSLDLINIVPNPYYGYCTYETNNRLDTRVKITNLPEICKVRIYTMNGTLIRTYDKDSDLGRDGTNYRTSIDWDLKNQKGIPIASGLYIIHVDAPGVGEKIIKWFGVMRPFDLQSY